MKPLHILHLEDDRIDAKAILHNIHSEGIEAEVICVENETDFISAIKRDRFDIILSDHMLPDFDGISALEIVREECPHVPFIFVSGVLGEEHAIETLKLGATDYVLKSHLSRLGPAIKRALKETEERKKLKEAEVKLNKSQERFISLLSSNPTMLYTCQSSPPYEVLFISENIKLQLGYEPYEFIRDSDFWLSHVYPEDVQRFIYGRPNVQEQGHYIHEYRFLHKDGSYRWMRDESRLMKDADELVGYWSDITDRKLMEDALRNSEERYRCLVENSPTGIFIHMNGKVVFANITFAKMLGAVAPQELIGKPLKDFILSDYQELTEERVQASVISKEQNPMSQQQLIRSDGRIIDIEATATPFILKDKTAMQVVVIDITERKSAEQKLKETLEFNQKIIEASSFGITAYNAITGQCVLANEASARIIGIPQEELIKLKFWHLQSWKEAGILNIAEKALATRSERRHQFHTITPSGREVWLECTFTFFIAGDALHLLLIFNDLTDLTERKRIAQELTRARDAAEAASRAKSEFLGNMSHELRTPLNSILGYAQLFLKDEKLTDEQRRGIQIIEKSGNHLLNLINDILDIVKIEAQKVVIQKQPFDMRNLLNFIQNMIKINVIQKELSFFFECDEDIPAVVLGDEKKISQILLNLFSNAVKFTQKGNITFKVKKKDKKILFAVEDTGMGIPENKIEEIFSPFKQLSDHLRKSEGSGLGLTISRPLVRLLGGDLKVESIYGKGSKFWFEIELPEAPVQEVSKLMKDEEKINIRPLERQTSLLPPPEMIKNLYHLAKRGNLQALKEELEKIKEYASFYSKVKDMADACEIEKIINSLERFNYKK